MIFLELEQGSEAWLAARAGVITASMVKVALSTKKRDGEALKAAETFIADTALERVYGRPVRDAFVSWRMERGRELEAQARMAYEEVTGYVVQEAGLALTDDRLFGYSTDGFIGGDGMVEIKCPASSVVVLDMLETGDVSEYMHQMQTGLWITGRKWCDFIMYCPQLESVGNHLYVKRICRDEDFIDDMAERLLIVAGRVAQAEAIFRRKIKETTHA